MHPVIVQCPHCQSRMQVDPRFLSHDTICPSCRGPLKPCDNVAPPAPMPLPPQAQLPAQAGRQQTEEFAFDDDDRPSRYRETTIHHTHQPVSSFATGFGGCFGGCLGIALAFCLLVGGTIAGCVLLKNKAEQERIEKDRDFHKTTR